MKGFEEFFKYRIKTTPSEHSVMKQAGGATAGFSHQCYETAIVLAIKVLNDVCGFGEKRVQRIMDRWDFKTQCMEEGYVTWQEQVDYIIRGELGIEPEVGWMIERKLIAS